MVFKHEFWQQGPFFPHNVLRKLNEQNRANWNGSGRGKKQGPHQCSAAHRGDPASAPVAPHLGYTLGSINNPVICHMRAIRWDAFAPPAHLPTLWLPGSPPPNSPRPSLSISQLMQNPIGDRQGQTNFYTVAAGHWLSYRSNNTCSTDNCFCHCILALHGSNYRCREMEGKSILFKSVLVSANTL